MERNHMSLEPLRVYSKVYLPVGDWKKLPIKYSAGEEDFDDDEMVSLVSKSRERYQCRAVR